MRSGNDWLQYLQVLSEQGRDVTQHASVYALQWARDVRCLRDGIEHRRVGEAAQHGHDEWLQAGFVAQQPLRR